MCAHIWCVNMNIHIDLMRSSSECQKVPHSITLHSITVLRFVFHLCISHTDTPMLNT